MECEFKDRSFCFTGALTDLKRSAAQREVRARGGLTLDRINERLDYLVIGSKGSPGWKHGSYGRKIESARELRDGVGRPRIVSEPEFMSALAACPVENAGEIDAKVVVATYKFKTGDPPTVDEAALEGALRVVQSSGAHITVKAFPMLLYREVFEADDDSDAHIVVEIRIVRQVALSFDSVLWIEGIERSLEAVEGIDGSASWFERVEGSADYVRLLVEVPQTLRVPGL